MRRKPFLFAKGKKGIWNRFRENGTRTQLEYALFPNTHAVG